MKATVEGTDYYTELCETKVFSIAIAASTLSFAEVTVSATIGETVENTLTVTPEGVTVSYSSSDEKVATVDASTGAITLVKPSSRQPSVIRIIQDILPAIL